MNRVILIGNIASEIESRTTQSGILSTVFRIAVQRRFKNAQGQRETDFLNVVCWRQTAEFCTRYLAKGRKVAVEGSIQTRSYDAQDGSKRYVTEIIAESVEAMDKAQQKAQACAQAPAYGTSAGNEGFTEYQDDDLPF